MAQEGQQHPLNVYFWIWGLLFVLSFLSYMVDYINFQGPLRWTLILIFMFLKAGFILAIFMHVAIGHYGAAGFHHCAAVANGS